MASPPITGVTKKRAISCQKPLIHRKGYPCNGDRMMTEVVVTDADREALAAYFRSDECPLSVKFTMGGNPAAMLSILARHRELGRLQGLEEAAKWFESDAELCDCFAHSASECACGAWDDRKTYGADKIPAAIRALAGKDRP